ncbi:hypothetical protein ACQPYA_06630 [Micromonospora sp. CA-263727]|uniref:hypothetical protein n=1 Tax=Micromonospora sp. CA-263727 TaxID=3239967 RepID=UPI003D8C8B2A
MTRALLARAGLLLAGTVTAILATAAPALAHGADAPNGTDYRAEVTAVTPARPELRVRLVEAGARLELTNTGREPVEVIGYSGEPYLRIGPDGVFENIRSPATYLNRTIAGETVLPAEVDPAAAPQWRRVDDGPTARWHDQRALWRESGPPAQVRAAPDREHRVRDWVVPLRATEGPVEIRGTLDWVPPPTGTPGGWWSRSARSRWARPACCRRPRPPAGGRWPDSAGCWPPAGWRPCCSPSGGCWTPGPRGSAECWPGC